MSRRVACLPRLEGSDHERQTVSFQYMRRAFLHDALDIILRPLRQAHDGSDDGGGCWGWQCLGGRQHDSQAATASVTAVVADNESLVTDEKACLAFYATTSAMRHSHVTSVWCRRSMLARQT
jgi:hypothetical protein